MSASLSSQSSQSSQSSRSSLSVLLESAAPPESEPSGRHVPLQRPDRTSPASQPYQLVGRIDVRPGLRMAEHEYLLAFAESRRWQRPAGPYAVPDNPLAECLQGGFDLERYVAVADGQPGPLCPWRPADDGESLVPHVDPAGCTSVPPSEVIAWLSYVCDHFLRPDGLAADAPECAGFGFDHVLEGAVAVCSPSTGALCVLRVAGNVLRIEEVSRGGPLRAA